MKSKLYRIFANAIVYFSDFPMSMNDRYFIYTSMFQFSIKLRVIVADCSNADGSPGSRRPTVTDLQAPIRLRLLNLSFQQLAVMFSASF